ncbi:MAG TPA: hypothetical protein VJ276_01585 [Thermoanaerobaculia bacterium]|nr:hypothetical protein [Thermoanaerobaculia bacterium]
MRIGDFDPSAGSFSVDMWVWTHSPPGSKLLVGVVFVAANAAMLAA